MDRTTSAGKLHLLKRIIKCCWEDWQENKICRRLRLMTLLNGLLTEKPTVREESHCEHIRSDRECAFKLPGQDFVPHTQPLEKSWPLSVVQWDCVRCHEQIWLLTRPVLTSIQVSTQLWTSHQWASLLCVTLANYHVQLSQNRIKCYTVTFQERPISFNGASYTSSTASAPFSLISLGAEHLPPLLPTSPIPFPFYCNISISFNLKQHLCHCAASCCISVSSKQGCSTAVDSTGRDSSATARGVVLRSGCNQKFCRFQLTRALLNGLSQASVHPAEAVRYCCMTAKVAGRITAM